MFSAFSGFRNRRSSGWISRFAYGAAAAAAILLASPYVADAHQGCDLCTGKGKPAFLVFEYRSSPCQHSDNSQPAGKWSCQDIPSGTTPGLGSRATIVYKSGGKNGSSEMHSVRLFTESAFFRVGFSVPLKSESTFEITDRDGSKQIVTIHTSCSQPLLVGDQFGSLMIADVPEQTKSCVPGNGPDACASGLKVSSMTLTYAGGTCATSSNTQQAGKTSCSDSGALNPAGGSVTVVGGASFSVTTGSSFTVNATSQNGKKNKAGRLPSNTFLTVSAGGTQQLQIHTSCSAPLKVGDKFGSLRVDGLTFVSK